MQGLRSSINGLTVRNIESNSDQEEEDLEQHRPLEGEKEGDEAKDLLNERLLLTPQDQEDLLKDIAVERDETEAGEEEMTFNEEVSGKLGELHKQRALQTNLARQVTSPQDHGRTEAEERDEEEEQVEVHVITVDIVSHQGDKDEDMPQWLEFTFEKKKRKEELPQVTLQQVITEEPPKAKKIKTVHHLSKTGSSEVIADVAVPLQVEGQASPKYQISQVNLGKQTK